MTTDRAACRRKALALLARRAHFSRQLAAKLERRKWDTEVVASVVEQLESDGLLDDRENATIFVVGRLAREPLGRQRLVWELAKRGVSKELASQVVDASYPDTESDLVAEAARRWSRSKPRGEEAALARYLGRRGFSKGAIVTALSARRQAMTSHDKHS